jgi:two-component system, OmpR family, sensor kinase
MLSSLPGRVAIVAMLIGGVLGAAAIFLIDMGAQLYHQEANQRLHRDLARWLIQQYGFVRDGRLESANLPEIFADAMRINPNIEIYLLDAQGKILAFNAPAGRVKLGHADLQPIKRFLSTDAQLPILGTDPRHPDGRQVFSAAPIRWGARDLGYLYVVVGGELYQAWVMRVRSSRILQGAAELAVAIALVAVLSGLCGFYFLTRRVFRIGRALQEFKQGGFTDAPQGLPPPKARALIIDEIDELQNGFSELVQLVCRQVRQLRTADMQLRESVASVSHDLRTPLTALGGYLDTVLMKNETLSAGERRKYLELAMAQHARLARLVKAQFELALLESAAAAFQPQPSSLSDLVNDVGQKFEEAANAAGLSLVVELPQPNVQVCLDVGLIERVLENLISNAIRHTPAGGRIVLAVRSDVGRALVSVEDTGCGIPVDQQGNLFEWPSRGNKVARRNPEGAGLGLVIARRIIELHGGHIEVHSMPGSGSRFELELPLAGLAEAAQRT